MQSKPCGASPAENRKRSGKHSNKLPRLRTITVVPKCEDWAQIWGEVDEEDFMEVVLEPRQDDFYTPPQ